MPPLVISLDDTEYAIGQMEWFGTRVFGDRDWESELARLETAQRVPIENSLFGFLFQAFLYARELSQRSSLPSPTHARNILTYVYSTVYSALGYTVPLVTRKDVEFVRVVYPSPITAVVATLIKRETIAAMKQVNVGWAIQFRDIAASQPLDPFQCHLTCACILALLHQCGVPIFSASDEEVDMGGNKGDKEPPPEKKADPLSASETPSIAPKKTDKRFSDIGGCHKAKEELMHLAKRVSQPAVAQRWGHTRAFGAVLIHGPQGTGKTTLIQAFANEVSVPFYEVFLSDVLKGYINHSHAQLRALFAHVRKTGGVLCFNEADAMLVRRGSFNTSHEDSKLVNEWNNCMDALTADDRVIVFLSANFTEKIDSAAIRDGRVNKIIVLALPDEVDRREVMEVHIAQIQRRASDVVFEADLNLDVLVRRTAGLSPAAICDIITRAQIRKINLQLEGMEPGLIGTDDLLEGFAQRVVERGGPKKRRIGFSTTS